jgi:hypothetical protein
LDGWPRAQRGITVYGEAGRRRHGYGLNPAGLLPERVITLSVGNKLDLTPSFDEELLDSLVQMADFDSQAGMNPRCEGWIGVLELLVS